MNDKTSDKRERKKENNLFSLPWKSLNFYLFIGLPILNPNSNFPKAICKLKENENY